MKYLDHVDTIISKSDKVDADIAASLLFLIRSKNVALITAQWALKRKTSEALSHALDQCEQALALEEIVNGKY